MSFDLPANLERDIEQYAQAEHISPNEVVVRLLSKALSGTRRKAKSLTPLTEEELAALDRFFPGLDALDDVTDEQWDCILRAKRKMSKVDFSARA